VALDFATSFKSRVQARLDWGWASLSAFVYFPLLEELTKTSQIRENRETTTREPACFHTYMMASALLS